MTLLDEKRHNRGKKAPAGVPFRIAGRSGLSRLVVLLVILLFLVIVFATVQLLGLWQAPDVPRIKLPFNFLMPSADPREIVPAGFAYLLVHPGYLDFEKPLGGELEAVRSNVAAYGNYETYLANIRRLIDHIRSTSAPVIWAVEESRFLGRSKFPVSWKPVDNALVLVTKDMSGRLQDTFLLDGLIVYQTFEDVKEFLQQNNIRELHCAGELGWYDTAQALGDGQGCLTVLSQQFRDAGFDTKCISGCVFPLNAPPAGQSDNSLYSVRISDPTVPREAD